MYLNRLGGYRGSCARSVKDPVRKIFEGKTSSLCGRGRVGSRSSVEHIKQVRDHVRWRSSNDVDVPGGRGVCHGYPPVAQV